MLGAQGKPTALNPKCPLPSWIRPLFQGDLDKTVIVFRGLISSQKTKSPSKVDIQSLKDLYRFGRRESWESQ